MENKFNDGKTYGLQTLKDNVSLLDEETVDQVNTMVVEAAHQFVLKKNETLKIKSDTYVLETNVHFPTDLNLLWDSCRKGIDVMKYCMKHYGLLRRSPFGTRMAEVYVLAFIPEVFATFHG